jgi:hypothetical protein
VMKHDAALFIAEAFDQLSELCLTGRRQIKMRRLVDWHKYLN